MQQDKKYTHNNFIFEAKNDGVTLIRDFDGMYQHCNDPHGQSKTPENLSYQLVATTLDRAIDILNNKGRSPCSIIDIGCGLGYFTSTLKEKHPTAYVQGIDISATALKFASTHAPGCFFQQQDLKAADFREKIERQFDIAVALDSLYYFKEHEIDTVLTNLSSLIAKEGFLMVGYHLPDNMQFGLYIQSVDNAHSLLARYGMEIVYSFDVNNFLDKGYDDSPIGHHLYFLARKL